MPVSDDQPAASLKQESQSKPFHFKGEDPEKNNDNAASSRKRRRRHHHSSRHSSRQTKRSKHTHPGEDLNQYAETVRSLGRDRAFQESLFDAMGDDEGAAFWEGVYGQPIHGYTNTFVNEDTGEMEQMNDEEYAQYVRRKMWEKSQEGIEAAREEQKREKAGKKTEQANQAATSKQQERPYNNFIFDFEIEASLRRGQRRKDQKRWEHLWKEYLQKWEVLQALAKDGKRTADSTSLFLRNRIAWPVESGKRGNVDSEEVERFIKSGTESVRSKDTTDQDALLAALKVERVRWHPDKIQQRYGMDIDEVTMKGVTAVFQVFDRMWNDIRGAGNK